MIYIGNGRDYPGLHTVEYDFNDRILGTVVDLFKGIILRKQEIRNYYYGNRQDDTT